MPVFVFVSFFIERVEQIHLNTSTAFGSRYLKLSAFEMLGAFEVLGASK